jgi:glutathione synthase/RimK-type ligase-like ATP-grasp enzyme
MARLVVLENPKNWHLDVPGVEIVAARDYLAGTRPEGSRRTKVFNLCRAYGYQTIGYYVSLLAEARGHRPLPSVATLQDLRLTPVVRVVSGELEELVGKTLAGRDPGGFSLNIYFGRTVVPGCERLAQALFRYFPSPLLRADFSQAGGTWRLESVRPVGTGEIPVEDRPFAGEQATKYLQRSGAEPGSPSVALRYDLAILFDPAERDAPSDEPAIRRFVRAARTLGIDASVIGKDDFGRIAEFDALFLRETTSVNHHTYRFARRAEAEGLVVIDSPQSILRCANKVFQAEIFERHGIPCPRTVIVNRDNAAEIGKRIGFPVVVKEPDSSFSLGVMKAADEAELAFHLQSILAKSELAVAQEFMPSEFDWRVGVLAGRCLYVCKYHMARGHWQIRGGGSPDRPRFGRVEALPPGEAPPGAIEVALKAAALMGNDLYGVDVKEVDGRFLVIEVNDNPSLEAGYEDAFLKDELYLSVMRLFVERLERRGTTAS